MHAAVEPKLQIFLKVFNYIYFLWVRNDRICSVFWIQNVDSSNKFWASPIQPSTVGRKKISCWFLWQTLLGVSEYIEMQNYNINLKVVSMCVYLSFNWVKVSFSYLWQLLTFSFEVSSNFSQQKSLTAKIIGLYFLGTIFPRKYMPTISAVGLFCCKNLKKPRTRKWATVKGI